MAVLADRGVTAQKMIQRSLRLIGVYGSGDVLSADEGIDALADLNAMLDDWANENLMISAPSLDLIQLQPGVSTYVIGPTGDFVTNYPVEVDDSSYIQYNSLSYPLTSLTLTEYNNITLKNLTTLIPDSFWCNQTFPNVTITFYPVPAAIMTLNLWSFKQITSFTALTNLVALPPGYENAIVSNLCEWLAPQYGVAVPAVVSKLASVTKKRMKRTNYVAPMLDSDVGTSTNGRFNILAGRGL
mgnify:CR=1 FL=1